MKKQTGKAIKAWASYYDGKLTISRFDQRLSVFPDKHTADSMGMFDKKKNWESIEVEIRPSKPQREGK